MKSIYLKLQLFCLAFLFILCGCQESLDLSPLDSISDAIFWNTPEDFEKGANALYASMSGYQMYDVDADIVFQHGNNVSNSTLTTPDTDNSNYNNVYTRIRNCNNIMEKVAVSPIANEVRVYAAEAKFFRAYNYWALYRLYGGVILIDKKLDVDSPELYSSRSTPQETVDFILKDLKEAIPDLPEESEISLQKKGRITKGAARAFMARIALFEGTWRKYWNGSNANDYLDMAIENANAVINSGQYALYTGSGAFSYQKFWDEPGNNSSECILDRRYERLVAQHPFPSYMQQDGYLPTKQLADMYLCMDGLSIDRSDLFQGYETFTSEFENRDPRMSQTIMIPGTMAYHAGQAGLYEHWPFFPDRNYNTGYIIFKYKNQNPDYQMAPYNEQQNTHFHHIRYAEVLLTLAEALYEKNGSISDADLDRTINLIRQRAGLTTPLSNGFVSEHGLNMRDEIRRERTVELALEGYRRDDLRRWKTAETVLVQAIRGIKIVGTEWGVKPIYYNNGEEDINNYRRDEWQNRADADGFIVSETATFRSGFDPNKHYFRPLPAREINLNPNLQQNPGW